VNLYHKLYFAVGILYRMSELGLDGSI